MMRLAVEAGYLIANPGPESKPPVSHTQGCVPLREQVDRLAAAIEKPYGTLVYLLAYGGLRWDEPPRSAGDDPSSPLPDRSR